MAEEEEKSSMQQSQNRLDEVDEDSDSESDEENSRVFYKASELIVSYHFSSVLKIEAKISAVEPSNDDCFSFVYSTSREAWSANGCASMASRSTSTSTRTR